MIDNGNQNVLAGVTSTFDKYTTNDALADSQLVSSLIPWDWSMYLDQIKRFHLDYLVRRYGVKDYYPLDSKTDINYVQIL
jgi:hypothetical protein